MPDLEFDEIPIKYCPLCNNLLVLLSHENNMNVIKCNKEEIHQFSYALSKKNKISVIYIKEDIYNIIWQTFKKKSLVIYTLKGAKIDYLPLNYHNNEYIPYVEPDLDNLSKQIKKLINNYKTLILFK